METAESLISLKSYPAKKYMLIANNRNTRKRCKYVQS